MENNDPLEDELGKYETKWVAIHRPDRTIVGSGDHALDAKREAEAKGFSNTILFKVRSAGKVYAYTMSCIAL